MVSSCWNSSHASWNVPSMYHTFIDPCNLSASSVANSKCRLSTTRMSRLEKLAGRTSSIKSKSRSVEFLGLSFSHLKIQNSSLPFPLIIRATTATASSRPLYMSFPTLWRAYNSFVALISSFACSMCSCMKVNCWGKEPEWKAFFDSGFTNLCRCFKYESRLETSKLPARYTWLGTKASCTLTDWSTAFKAKSYFAKILSLTWFSGKSLTRGINSFRLSWAHKLNWPEYTKYRSCHLRANPILVCFLWRKICKPSRQPSFVCGETIHCIYKMCISRSFGFCILIILPRKQIPHLKRWWLRKSCSK